MRFDAIGLVFCVSLLSGCFLDGAGQQRGDGGGLDAGGPCGSAETCNGEDDDCDGATDEDTSLACGAAGTCTAGVRACVGGELATECTPTGTTAVEACEGSVDEDCDGTVDEGCGCTAGEDRACGEDAGACQPGTQVCTDATWGPCEGAIGPVAETCNGEDDDCNGTVDDGIAPEPCGSETGECTVGTRTCSGGALTDCSGILASAEVCDGAMLDEDCDGTSNEDCECTPGATESCSSGSCSGTRTCESGGTWGACDATAGTAETCNGEDDDCDGTIDEADSIVSLSPCAMQGQVYVELDDHAYLFVSDPTLTWDQARVHCMAFGYDLVVIETERENTLVAGTARGSAALGGPTEWWIGLHDTSSAARDYTWCNGATITYSGWAMSEPSHNDQCAMIATSRLDEPSGGWDDKNCGGGKAFICEAPPAAPPAP